MYGSSHSNNFYIIYSWEKHSYLNLKQIIENSKMEEKSKQHI